MGQNIIEELYRSARQKIDIQGDIPTDAGALEDIADEVIFEFLREGSITDDEDTELLKSELLGRLQDDIKNL